MSERLWQPDPKDFEKEPAKENPYILPTDVTGSASDDPGDDIVPADEISASSGDGTAGMMGRDGTGNISDNTSTVSDVSSDIGDDPGADIGQPFTIEEMQANDPLPRLEPLGPNDKEADLWNKEADEIEAWAREVEGGPDGYSSNLRQEMGWDAGESQDDIGQDIGGANSSIEETDFSIDSDLPES